MSERGAASPIASVVVPVHNAERWLPESLSDLLGQTLRDAEFVFVDDGSTDGSVRLLEEAAARDPRVRILRQNRRFAGCARNAGIDAARGRWTIALDADDRFERNLLEEAVRRGEETDADIVVFDADSIVMPSCECLRRRGLSVAGDLPQAPFRPGPGTPTAFRVMATWTKLYRLDFLRNGGFRYLDTFESNDISFSFLTMACARRVAALPRTLVHYRVGGTDNIQSYKDDHPLDGATAFLRLRADLAERGLLEPLRGLYVATAARFLLGCGGYSRFSSFRSRRAAEALYDRLKSPECAAIGLEDTPEDRIQGPDADSIRAVLRDFRTLSRDDWMWSVLRRYRDSYESQLDALARSRAATAEAKRTRAEAEADLSRTKRRLAAAERAAESLRRSLSCRIGFALTKPARLLHDAVLRTPAPKRNGAVGSARTAPAKERAPAKDDDAGAEPRRASFLRRRLGALLYSVVSPEIERRLRSVQPRTENLRAAEKMVAIHAVNRDRASCEMSLSAEPGVSGEDRPGGIVVSLTSYPARMYDVHFALHSLLSQTVKPERVVLWLGRERFPRGEETVPEKVLNLRRRGLEIRFCHDVRSFTKLLPALGAFPGKTIVTADDDVYYDRDWLERIERAAKPDPRCIWAARVRRILASPNGLAPYETWPLDTEGAAPSFANFPTGVGGVLYPPGALHPEVANEAAFRELTPAADDIWFWAMAVRNGTRIGAVPGFPGWLTYVNPRRELGLSDEGTLMSGNYRKRENDPQLEAVMRRYPEVREALERDLAAP